MKRILFLDSTNGDIEQFLKRNLTIENGFHGTQIFTLNNFLALIKLSTWDLFIGYHNAKDNAHQQIIDYIEQKKINIPCIACIDGLPRKNDINLLRQGVFEVLDVKNHDLLQLFVNRALLYSSNLKRLYKVELERDEERGLRQFLSQCSEDAIAYISQGILVGANQTFVDFFGSNSVEDTIWTPFLDFIAQESKTEIRKLLADEIRMLTKEGWQSCQFQLSNGDTEFFSLHYSPGKVDGQSCIQMTIKKMITKTSPHEIYNAGNDYLTGLVNRKHFLSLVEKIINSPINEDNSDYVLFIKLDRFENTITEIGLSKSDQLIYNLSQLLKSLVGENVCSARFSEQVFSILFINEPQAKILTLVQKIVDSFANHVTKFGELKVAITVSVGVSIISRNVENAYTVMSNAHTAYHDALEAGGNTFRMYDPKSKSELLTQNKMLQLIEYALADNSIEECYIPFFVLRGDNETQYEVVARIDEVKSNNLQKSLKLGTNNSVAILIDKWVISRAFKQIKDYKCEKKSIKLFCYLSESSICDIRFKSWLEQKLIDSNIPHGLLNFELDITTIINYPQRSRQVCDKLVKLGCNIAISNITTKIDKQQLTQLFMINFQNAIFNSKMFEKRREPESVEKIKSLVNNFRNKKKITIARQIHSNEQLVLLWDVGVDYFQNDAMLSAARILDNDYRDNEDCNGEVIVQRTI